MDKSIFDDKTKVPNAGNLVNVLDEDIELWNSISDYVFSKYPKAIEEWNFTG